MSISKLLLWGAFILIPEIPWHCLQYSWQIILTIFSGSKYQIFESDSYFQKQPGLSEPRFLRWRNQYYFGIKTKVLVIVKQVRVSCADPKIFVKIILKVLWIMTMLVWHKVHVTKVTTSKRPLTKLHSQRSGSMGFAFADSTNSVLKSIFHLQNL